MLENLYYIFTLVLVVVLIIGFKYFLDKTADNEKVKRSRLVTMIAVITLWVFYLFLLSYTEALQNFELPPRFPLLVMLPAFIMIVIFLRKNRQSAVIDKIPPHIPVLFQSFRIPVELLIHGTFLAGLIPIETTYNGYNFEIYLAASALIVGILVYKKFVLKKLLLIWNVIGLGFLSIILGIFMTAIFFPQFWGETSPMVNLDLGTLPYLFVPGFYVPLAILMHGISIIQATRK